MMRAMADVCFLPNFAEVLEQVVRAAHAQDGVDLECGPDVDVAVVAGQIRWYAERAGRPVRCTARVGRVEVRVARPRRGRVA